MQKIPVVKTHKNIFSDELFTLTREPIGEAPITDNQWFKNGYNVGDILVFSNKYRRYPVEILGYKMIYINRELTASGVILSSFPNSCCIEKTGFSRGSSVETWEMRTTKKYLRFKAQDYIKDLSNPTQNELLQINLEFPDVNVKDLIEGINNLLEIKKIDESIMA